jgi:2,4-dienoyl-CoA reductase-like NADH-dependent reductase (Old Yellow Enzyme family)
VLDVRDAAVALRSGIHVAFGTQAQEAFLEGHVLAFEHFGGVPARVRYDNLNKATPELVAPSAIAAPGEIVTRGGMKTYPVPRALTETEIPTVIAEFVHAA